jgi:hypothetical protein
VKDVEVVRRWQANAIIALLGLLVPIGIVGSNAAFKIEHRLTVVETRMLEMVPASAHGDMASEAALLELRFRVLRMEEAMRHLHPGEYSPPLTAIPPPGPLACTASEPCYNATCPNGPDDCPWQCDCVEGRCALPLPG